MIINVTKEHIRKGVAGNPHCCPIALALLDVLPVKLDDVFVSVGGIKVTKRQNFGYYEMIRREGYAYPIAEDVSQFILNYDNTASWIFGVFAKWRQRNFKPFSFEVDIDMDKIRAL